MIKKKKIIIDTDNGDDIDDLITLYFALHLKDKFEIIGIISSFLNTPLRKKQVEYTLKLFGVNKIPLFAGCRKPMEGIHSTNIKQSYCQYFDFLGKAGKQEENEAINFMIESAKKYKEDLTILEIAPQTTLAKAILKDKEAFKDCNITLMAGWFYARRPEWNIECDALASKIVLESDLKLRYVGCDVTLKTTLRNKKIENLFLNKYENEKLNFLSMSSNAWVKCSKRHIVLHDPLALLTIIDDDICKFKKEPIISRKRGRRYFTIIDKKSTHIYDVAYKVDIHKVYEYVKDMINNEK